MRQIDIKSYNGIGDLLFVTPTLRWLKTWYKCQVRVMTNRPELLEGNPFVDEVANSRARQTHRTDEEGLFLGYPDPIHAKNPTKHHILSDFDLICGVFGVAQVFPWPELKPEIYALPQIPTDQRNGKVGVQMIHKGHWHQKKIWPFYEDLVAMCPEKFEPIPKVNGVLDLVRAISQYEAVVCAEGGISHIARAMDTPALVIMGGFHRPEWAGYEEHTNLVDEEIWCRDECYNPGPCKSKVIERECLRQWSAEDVLEMSQW